MIFTFYSFKGGVGRSMALANIAELFYARGLRVLMIDFDLEAPGLERYFDVKNSATPLAEALSRRGVIDIILSFLEFQSLAPKLPPMAMPGDDGQPSFPFSVEPLKNFIVPIYDDPSLPGRLSLMPSGNRRKPDFTAYAKRVLDFEWARFYTEKDGERFFEWFRYELTREWDVVLIDSRTGVTELGGVCTHHLADAVVSFVATNFQNLEGTEMMASSLANPKLVSEGRRGRALQQLFVPSRVDSSEEDKHDVFAARFNSEFASYFPQGQTPQRSWFLDLRLPYSPAYSYMERVAVREQERASKADLIEAYGRLAARMANLAGTGALFEAWAPSSRTVSNLPPRNLYFEGRDEDLKRIRTMLTYGTPVAICGLGGMGKTALAIEYAYRYRSEYSAVLFCPAGSEDDLRRGCEELMRLLSITTADISPRDAVRMWLEGNDGWLLILDDALDPALIRSMMPQSLRGQVLMTTRTQQVTAMGAQPVPIDSISSESSISFFEKRLGKHDWTDMERSSAVELIEEVGSLPLALEQAAAYIVNRGVRVQDYLASYRKRRLGLLDQQVALSAGRELSVSVALEPSLEEIEKLPASSDVLCAASFLASDPIPAFLLVAAANELGGPIASALASAADDPLAIDEVLDPLTRYSLIRRNRESQTFSVHNLVADLVRARVSDPTAWQQRVTAALEAAFPEPTWENAAICASLIPHVVSVLRWTTQPTLRFRAAKFLTLRGEYARAEECLRGAGTGGETLESVMANQLLARIYFFQSRFQDALPLLEQSLALCRKLGVEDGLHTDLLLNLAGNYAGVNDMARAEKYYALAFEESQKHGATQTAILALCGRAGTLVASNPTEAIESATMAVEYAQEADLEQQAMAYQSLASVLIDGGRAMEPQTMEVLQKALAAAERVYGPQHPGLAESLRVYAVLLHAHGREAEAQAVYRRAQEIVENAFGPQSATSENFRNLYERMIAMTTAQAAGERQPQAEPGSQQDAATPPPASKTEEKQPLALATPLSAASPFVGAVQSPPAKSSRMWIIGAAVLAVLLAIWLIVHLLGKQTSNTPQPSPANIPNANAPATGAEQNPAPQVAAPSNTTNRTAPEWGVIVSADKTLLPAAPGGPSAEWEPVRAWRANYRNAVLFHRDAEYWTVLAEPDRQSAEAAVKKFKANPPYEHWSEATVVHVSDWCPAAQFSTTVQMAEASMDVYECGRLATQLRRPLNNAR
jgi:cellulose biosynthesis protein BcsQ/tetratricopeptide (TPR) repeat protein